MANRCGWCHHPDGHLWTQRVLNGEAVRAVARSTPYSDAAGQRHLQNHVQPELRRTSPARVSSFVERLLGLADDAAMVRERALQTSNSATVLKAAAVEHDVLGTLMGRLGINSATVAAELAEADALAAALLSVVREHPDWPILAEHLAPELDRQGAHELADAMRDQPQRPVLEAVPSTREISS